MTAATSTSAWAVARVLAIRTGMEIPESTVFGLGASLWYWLADAAGAHPVLRTLHPERIKHSLYAMHVDAARFNFLSSDAYLYLQSRVHAGTTTLVCVDGFAFERAVAGVGPGAGARPYEADLALLVLPDSQRAYGDMVRLQSPARPDALCLPRAQFEAIWYRDHGDAQAATHFWHPTRKLRFDLASAMRGALRRHVRQMTHCYPTLGATGLQALSRLIQHARQGDTRALAAAAACARIDGGFGCGHAMMAAFLRDAALTLALPALERSARCYELCAGLWRELLPACAAGPVRPAQAVAILSTIVRQEQAAVHALRSVFPDHAAREAACLS